MIFCSGLQARQGIGVHGQHSSSADQAQATQANSTGRGKGKAAAAQQAGAAKHKRLLPVPDVPEALEVKCKRHQQVYGLLGRCDALFSRLELLFVTSKCVSRNIRVWALPLPDGLPCLHHCIC